jgi:hypothetical protein
VYATDKSGKNIKKHPLNRLGRCGGGEGDGVVSIATRFGLDGPEIEWGKFSAPLQTDTGVHPASYAMGTTSLSRVQSDRGVALTTHPHLAPRLKKE